MLWNMHKVSQKCIMRAFRNEEHISGGNDQSSKLSPKGWAVWAMQSDQNMYKAMQWDLPVWGAKEVKGVTMTDE